MKRVRVAELRRTPPLLLLQKVVRQVPFTPVDVGKLCFLRLDRIPRVPAGLLRGPGLVGRVTADDLDRLLLVRDQRAVFLERFAKGDHCVAASVDGRIVGYEWFCDRPVHHETAWGYDIVVPPGFVYAYDAYIAPPYRNSGIWLRFKAYLGELMLQSGHAGVLTFVEYGNWPSLRTHLRFGFTPDREVFVLKVLGRLFARPAAARASVESHLAGASVR